MACIYSKLEIIEKKFLKFKNITSQPWYHVLVHDTDRTTYAAEENLGVDGSGQPIHHPLVAHFFSDLVDGRYIRNDQPWLG